MILLGIPVEFPLRIVKTRPEVCQREQVDIDLHLLELRFEALRTRNMNQERRLMASLASMGQQLPLVVVRSEEANRYVLVDGYKRVRVLRKLRQDRACPASTTLPGQRQLEFPVPTCPSSVT